MQEEIKRNTRDSVTSTIVEEEDCALVGKGNKVKGMKAQGEVESNQNNGKKKDLNKIKYFHYQVSAQEMQQGTCSKSMRRCFGISIQVRFHPLYLHGNHSKRE